MKKISLKKLNLEAVEKLSREQLKDVLGGWNNHTTGSGGGGRYMCCPESIASGVGCSTCVDVPAGSTASCPMGELVAC